MNLWFTADTHFGHKGIIPLCNRPYRSVDEMDEDLIARFNQRVRPKDTVYLLGDIALKARKYVGRLNGKKHLIIGNHDPSPTKLASCYLSVQDVQLLKLDNQRIWLSHYAHVAWPGSHRGTWHLFGHSHGCLSAAATRGRRMLDVGVDCHAYAPVSFDEIKAYMHKVTDAPPTRPV